MAAGRGLEWSTRLRDQVDNLQFQLACVHGKGPIIRSLTYLSTPAVAQNTPTLDIGILRLELCHDFLDPLNGLGWSSCGLEELAELLAFLLCVRGIP